MTKFCKCNFKKPLTEQTLDGDWVVSCHNCGKEVSADTKFDAISKWDKQYGTNVCFCCESSKVLPKNINAAESNLSVSEIEKRAKKDATEGICIYTLSPLYLRTLISNIKCYDVSNDWSFVILKNNGEKINVDTFTLCKAVEDDYCYILSIPIDVYMQHVLDDNKAEEKYEEEEE